MIYLSLLMAIRFFGLFIVMPLLALYALNLQNANAFNVGIALGAYALSQVFLQIPFGKAADRFDKKKILITGLVLLTAGSIVCAFSTNIYTLIFGRLLQGAGAIGGVILAFIADLTDENERAKAFARMGMFIALSFGLSMILGPTVGAAWGVDKLFILTAFLAVFSIGIVVLKIPNPPKIIHHKPHSSLKKILTHKELLKLFFSGFLQKSLMTVFFMLTPIIFTTKLHWDKTELYKVYIPALILGIFALPLGAILAEKKQKPKTVFIMSSIAITLSLILFLIGSKYTYFAAVIIFFFGFNLLEPVLQSFISKTARANEKATALSTSNTIQYIGIFIGGGSTGYFIHHDMLNVFLVLSILISLFWTSLLIKMKPALKLKTIVYEKYDNDFIEKLKTEKNVYDFYEKDGLLIVRYSEN